MKTTVEMTATDYEPLGDRVLMRAIEPETKTSSGILLPEKGQEKTQLADVLGVGPEVTEVAAGDQVLYVKYSEETVKVGGEDLLVVHEDDLLAKYVPKS